jgi:hypothetical protein
LSFDKQQHIAIMRTMTHREVDPAGDHSPVCDTCGEYVDGGGCACPHCHLCGEIVAKAEDLDDVHKACAQCLEELNKPQKDDNFGGRSP